jgi:hypothetical protein
VPNLLDDLACPTCGGYAHPFLDACPACGTARGARYEDAVARGELGYGKVLEDPRLERQVREVVLRYSLKSAPGEGAAQLRAGLGMILDALPYAVRVVGPGAATSGRANVELAADELVVGERSPSREVVRVPLESVLAVRARTEDRPAGAWTGLEAFGRQDHGRPPDVDGDLVLSYAAGDGLGRLSLANRRGLTAVRARPDHYAIVARTLGVFAAAAAEARWVAVGAERHAVELGLAPPLDPAAATAGPPRTSSFPGPTSGTPGSGASAAGPAPASPAAAAGDRDDAGGAIADALATLEALRARGLVTESEYAEKRREILARL